jgi:ribose/xylose/arabinose/galactoside ABC-type transport system permease subunit
VNVSEPPVPPTEQRTRDPMGQGWSSGRTRSLLLRTVFSEYLVLYLCLAYLLILWPFEPELVSRENLSNIFTSALPLLAVTLGQTFVLITGGIDLSLTAIIALSSVGGAWVMTADGGWLAGSPFAVPAAVMVMLLIGIFVGLLNGTAVSRFNMPPFIVTLAVMMFFSGFAIWTTQSNNIYNLPGAFATIGQGSIGPVPWALVLVGVLALTAHFVLARTVYGRWLYAAGSSLPTSVVSGVPVKGVITGAYVASGICAAVASIIYTSRLETGSPVMGERILLDVVAAAVIGGTSLFGGKGKVLWTVFGVLFITLVDNSLNMMGLSYFSILMAKGLVILFAALLDAARSRLRGEA